MKKAFVWDPVMRSSASKYDPCVVLANGKCKKLICDDCKITIISDRFLGEEFHKCILRKINKSQGRYPYVIIADTLGCNLKCWFCYAYKFHNKIIAEDSGCLVSYVTPERLAEQFYCKIQKLSDFDQLIKEIQEKDMKEREKQVAIKHLQLKLPLMRIRISGGEPLFSTRETLKVPPQEDLIQASLNYWLTFFEKLDEFIGKLKKDGKLHIINRSEIENKKWEDEFPFPTCLAERPGRLNIRFDTNGILFGEEKITESFIGGLFTLFEEKKLNNLFVEIDYSFKGATPVEYDWSQARALPVDPSKINFDYKLENHPQLPGYYNIIKTIEKYCSQNKNFYNCVGITVERGINHHIPFKTYVNCKESLNWNEFSKRTGIRFSIVDNPIEMFNWRDWRPKSYFLRNKANIMIITDNEIFDLKNNPDMNEFDKFRKAHYPNCHFVIFPIEEKITLKKFTRRREIETIPTGWIFSGNKENWIIALKYKKWGLRKEHRTLWEKIKIGDYALFYVTRPISKLVGYATIKNTIEEYTLLWPDEIREKNIKYPLKIYFENILVLPEKSWSEGLRSFGLIVQHGINPIYEREKLEKLLITLKSLIKL